MAMNEPMLQQAANLSFSGYKKTGFLPVFFVFGEEDLNLSAGTGKMRDVPRAKCDWSDRTYAKTAKETSSILRSEVDLMRLTAEGRLRALPVAD